MVNLGIPIRRIEGTNLTVERFALLPPFLFLLFSAFLRHLPCFLLLSAGTEAHATSWAGSGWRPLTGAARSRSTQIGDETVVGNSISYHVSTVQSRIQTPRW